MAEIAEAPVVEKVSTPVIPSVPTPVESEISKMRAKLTTPIEKVVTAPEIKKEVPPATKEVAQIKTTEVKTDAKPVAAPSEADEFLKNASPKTQKRFVELAEEKAEAKYQERLKTLKLLTPEVEENLIAAEKRAQDAEAVVRQTNIEQSPEYKTKFVDRPKAIRSELSAFAKTWEIPETDLINAVEGGKDSRRQLNTLLESIGTMDRADVTELAREFQKIHEDKKAVLTDFDLAQKLLEEKRFNETKAGVEKLIAMRSESLRNTVLPQMEKEYAPVFEGEEGAALKTKVIGHIEKLNGCNLETMTPADRATMVTCAFMAQPLLKILVASKARVAELEAKLSQADAIVPNLGGRSTGSPPEENPKGAFQRMREEVGASR